MFVSSYSTYIATNSSHKSQKYGDRDANESLESFSKNLLNSTVIKPYANTNLLVDYISNYKSLSNQQKLHERVQEKDTDEFKKLTIINNAKTAYDEGIKIFSLSRNPPLTLSQTPKIDEKLPKEIQEAKEKSLRSLMINTYLTNDKYYKITAA